MLRCLPERASGNYTAVSSRERFTAALKSVFTVNRAEPPPPPSSRRAGGHARTPSRRPAPKPPGALANTPASEVASDDFASSPHAPDSLIPVRMTDLLSEPSADAESRPSGFRRARIPIVGSFVAGVVVVLALQAVLAPANRGSAASAPRPGEPLRSGAVEPNSRSASIGSQSALGAGAPVEEASTVVPPAATGTDEPALIGRPAAIAEHEPPIEVAAPAAAPVSSGSTEDKPPEHQPAEHRRRRVRPASTHEPPTAEFPDSR